MRFGFCLCQTMMSSQVRPPKRDSQRLGSLQRRDDPSFTMSNSLSSLAGPGENSLYLFAIVWMVEPDGIEPTTSCLQSTRSTN